MRGKLIDILESVSAPRIIDGVLIGEYRIPRWFAEKLADELIKNGVTISTFKVGDIVWVYDFMWGIIPCTIDRPYHCHAGREGSCTYENSFTELDIGKYVFATKEEAEKYWYTPHEGEDVKNLYLD